MDTDTLPSGRWPYYSQEERAAVDRILASGKVNYWTGDEGRQFEQEFADYIGVHYAIAVANGTVALELCLRALGIGHGDEVIVTPRSFIASANVIVQVGATPVFADIAPASQNLDPISAEAAITPRTKAIILVHLAGWPCEMAAFQKIAQNHDLHLIEDCAQAHGAQYAGGKVGSFGSISAFSFCQDKIISTGGEGGMVVTDDEALWRYAWSYKDHGKNPDKITDSPPAGSGFRWLHDSIGTNYRMTEIQSAIGRLQLRGLETSLTRRAAIVERYNAAFSSMQGVICHHPQNDPNIRHANYVYYLEVDERQLAEGWNRDRIIDAANAQIPVFRSGACPEMYLEDAFQHLPGAEELRTTPGCPEAQQLGLRTIMLPCHHHLTEEQQKQTIQTLASVMALALKSGN